jgi:hypothetical protein
MKLRAHSAAIAALFFSSCTAALAAPATWIWYPGDFEIWLSNEMQVKRGERDALFMPFWRYYSHQPMVNFSRQVELAAPETIEVTAEGQYSVLVDGKFVQGDQRHIALPAGKHHINVQVYNAATPPAIHVQGPTVRSDGSWTVGPKPFYQPLRGAPVQAAGWHFDTAEARPSRYRLPTKDVAAASVQRGPHSLLVDFGQETIGFVKLKNVQGQGKVTLYYGESLEEAQATETCETLDRLTTTGDGDMVSPTARAMRYVNIEFDEGVAIGDVSLQYEYLPLTQRGSFQSSDPGLNRIWDVSLRTLELNTREFFLDGIKRDHWIWSGDAAQAYLMNYYAFFDSDTVKRTTWALRGADPVDMHINTILDYSLYWFIGISDYYRYTGDAAFVQSIYPRMVTLMDFVLSRRNADGMLEGLPGDWVFVDWAPMPTDGELAVIQLLLARSLEAMADASALVKDSAHETQYRAQAAELKQKIMATFWDPQRQAFIHRRKDGKLDTLVTRHPNMFALMFGYLDAAQAEAVKRNVLMNDQVQKITTPYMRFYELAALAQSGQHDYVTGQVRDYWGGMLKDGATCFWEQYDPRQKAPERYAMYGKAFGKSLCHAWGASPLYLFGRYYLGVQPTQPGYAAYVVEPRLGGLEWISGKVPTPHGDIEVAASRSEIKVKAAGGQGVLRFASANTPRSKQGVIRKTGADSYEIALEGGREYVVAYTPPGGKAR